MNARRSRGPWHVYPSGTSVPGYDVCDRIVSDTWTGSSLSIDGMSDDDAAFIVRACNSHDQLLAALRDLLGANLDANGADLDIATTLAERLGEAMIAAGAAIAKAEGRS